MAPDGSTARGRVGGAGDGDRVVDRCDRRGSIRGRQRRRAVGSGGGGKPHRRWSRRRSGHGGDAPRLVRTADGPVGGLPGTVVRIPPLPRRLLRNGVVPVVAFSGADQRQARHSHRNRALSRLSRVPPWGDLRCLRLLPGDVLRGTGIQRWRHRGRRRQPVPAGEAGHPRLAFCPGLRPVAEQRRHPGLWTALLRPGPPHLRGRRVIRRVVGGELPPGHRRERGTAAVTATRPACHARPARPAGAGTRPVDRRRHARLGRRPIR